MRYHLFLNSFRKGAKAYISYCAAKNIWSPLFKIEKNVDAKQERCDPNVSMASFTKCAFMPFENLNCTSIFTKFGMNFSESNICTDYKTFRERNKLIKRHLINTLR